MMKLRAAIAALALTGTSALALGGCTPTPSSAITPTPGVTVSPTPTPTPTLSEEQNAATAAVVEFSSVRGQIARGEAAASDLDRVARDPVAGVVIKYVNELAAADLTERGQVTITRTVPGEVEQRDGRATVVVQACLDQTQLQIVDESGKDVMSAESKVIEPRSYVVQQWDGDWLVTENAEGELSC